MSLQFDSFLLILSGLLPIGVYTAIFFVAVTRRSAPIAVRRRVAIGALLCATSLVVAYGLRIAMTRTVPAARFATLVPTLNLGQSLVSMTGVLLMVSAAFVGRGNVQETEPPAGERTETGNPYEPI